MEEQKEGIEKIFQEELNFKKDNALVWSHAYMLA